MPRKSHMTLAGQFATSTSGQVEEKESLEVPVPEENQEVKCSPLNPDVPVWKGYKCSPSAINCGSAEGGLLEQHLDLSDKNDSHMIEVQKRCNNNKIYLTASGITETAPASNISHDIATARNLCLFR